MSLVVKSKLKEVVPGFNVAGDLSEELNRQVTELLKKASARAESNGRKTIMSKDL
jgi:histone H3/H4